MRHDTIVVTRHVDAAPDRVFAAFTDPEILKRWMKAPGAGATRAFDPRVGSGDLLTAVFTHPDGRVERVASATRYIELRPGQRVVYQYASSIDDVTRWTSLVTVELSPADEGTDLTWTEQVAFLVPTDPTGQVDIDHLAGAIRLRLNGLPALLAG